MLVLIDNYDSFAYNLYQMLGALSQNITVIRNDVHTVAEILALNPSRIVLSPGPGKPSEAGICIELIQKLPKNIPLLGVCLGHQAIFEAFGGTVSYAKELMHGKQSLVHVDMPSPLFLDMPQDFLVARYHSLVGLESTLPQALQITAHSTDGEIMAVEHKDLPIFGLQFHPESIMTPQGATLLKNFMEIEL